jgi:hypothetical protein
MLGRYEGSAQPLGRLTLYLWLAAAHRLTAVSAAGYFQPMKGQFGCVSCDSLGDFYQDLGSQTLCKACPANTKRYPGVLTAASRASCQCKEGDGSITIAALERMQCGHLLCRQLPQRWQCRRGAASLQMHCLMQCPCIAHATNRPQRADA